LASLFDHRNSNINVLVVIDNYTMQQNIRMMQMDNYGPPGGGGGYYVGAEKPLKRVTKSYEV
jgi:hypothetical protein